jgi:hypothetical protein
MYYEDIPSFTPSTPLLSQKKILNFLISVADPGCFIPDPDLSICSSQILDLGSRILVLCKKKWGSKSKHNFFMLLMVL